MKNKNLNKKLRKNKRFISNFKILESFVEFSFRIFSKSFQKIENTNYLNLARNFLKETNKDKNFIKIFKRTTHDLISRIVGIRRHYE